MDPAEFEKARTEWMAKKPVRTQNTQNTVASPSATAGSLQKRELGRNQPPRNGRPGTAFQNMAGTPSTLNAIHAAHAAATIVKIETANTATVAPNEQQNGTSAYQQGEHHDVDDTMADSDNLEDSGGSMGSRYTHGGEESFACDRDPLALNLGQNSTMRNEGLQSNSQGNTDNLNFGAGGSRLETWVRNSDFSNRGVTEQIPEHLLPEM